ncbi:MAG: hypothetical protein ACK5XX_04695 [Holosporales bacterium]|jgi:hypothetical protein
MENNIDNIPTPDTSGAENTQRVEQFSPKPDSPMGMGNVAYGLAADSGNGLNRQAAIIVTTDYVNLRNRLDKKEQRLEEVLPRLAVLEAENKNLRKQRKIGAITNFLGVLLISFGTSILASVFFTSVTQGVQVVGGIFTVIGILLHAITIFTSWSSD